MKKHLLYLACSLFFLAAPVHAQHELKSLAEQPAEGQSEDLLLPVHHKLTGDLDEIKANRTLRILVPYSDTIYFLDGAHQFGTAVDAAHQLEYWMNKRYNFGLKALKMTVTLVPTPRERLLTALSDGYGDIAAGNLTITKERLKKIDFTIPLISNVREIVVTGPTSPSIGSLDELLGKEVYVRATSSYYEHITALNKRLKKEGRQRIKLIPADENLEDEDILELVNAGAIPFTIVDDHVARFWVQVLPNIRPLADVFVNEGGSIAWAVRKNCPKLLAEINEFARTHGEDTSFGRSVLNKYLRSTKYVVNSTSTKELKKFSDLIGFFRRYGSEYDFEPLMLVAMGYQESRLNQRARSHAGAVGVMQVMPATAAMPTINIKGIAQSAEKNIHAASKYLRLLVDTYVNDPKIDAKNRTLMVFAAYNAGPGNLNKFRDLAKRSGLDPNVWFNNVEVAAARIVGRETVHYVSNIYKYYIAYKLVTERQRERDESIQKMNKTGGT